MSTRNKSWFFTAPPTTAGDRFVRNNIPSEQTYRDLLDSVAMILEQGSTAMATRQGLVKLASDSDVKTRTSPAATEFQAAIRAHQLPLIILGSTEVMDTVTPVTGGGLKGTYTEVASGSNKRYSTKLELNFANLTEEAPAAGDWIAFEDLTDGVVKKVAYSDMLAGGFWQRNTTIISPLTAGDSLDMGTAQIKCGSIYFDNNGGGIRFIAPIPEDDDDGIEVNIIAGLTTDPTKTGGDLLLYGGTNLFNDSGSVYIAPGTANVGGVTGNVIIGYTKAGVKTGKVGIGGPADAAYTMKVYSGILLATGAFQHDGIATGTISKIAAWDASNVALGVTAAVANTFLFGAAAKGEVLWYNGSAWTRLAVPVADAWLHFDIGTGDVVWDTTGSGGSGDDELVSVTAGHAGYLDAVLINATNGGTKFTVDGDNLKASLYLDNLDEVVAPLYDSSIAISYNVGPVSYTKKLLLRNLLGGSDGAGWSAFTAGSDYTAAPASTSRILTTDLTDDVEPGLPLKYKINGISNYCYGIIVAVAATHIDIAGDPLTANIDELYIGGKEKIVTKTLQVNSATYNSSMTESLLETKQNMKEGDRWTDGTAKLVKFEAIHIANDSTQPPYINVRCGEPASITDYVSTSNTTKGIVCSTALNSTIVDIDHTKNTINYGENVEVKVDNNSGTGDAQYLTVYLTFVKK